MLEINILHLSEKTHEKNKRFHQTLSVDLSERFFAALFKTSMTHALSCIKLSAGKKFKKTVKFQTYRLEKSR
jgi:hypothetical protein